MSGDTDEKGWDEVKATREEAAGIKAEVKDVETALDEVFSYNVSHKRALKPLVDHFEKTFPEKRTIVRELCKDKTKAQEVFDALEEEEKDAARDAIQKALEGQLQKLEGQLQKSEEEKARYAKWLENESVSKRRRFEALPPGPPTPTPPKWSSRASSSVTVPSVIVPEDLQISIVANDAFSVTGANLSSKKTETLVWYITSYHQNSRVELCDSNGQPFVPPPLVPHGMTDFKEVITSSALRCFSIEHKTAFGCPFSANAVDENDKSWLVDVRSCRLDFVVSLSEDNFSSETTPSHAFQNPERVILVEVQSGRKTDEQGFLQTLLGLSGAFRTTSGTALSALYVQKGTNNVLTKATLFRAVRDERTGEVITKKDGTHPITCINEICLGLLNRTLSLRDKVFTDSRDSSAM